jgi:WD40 repeat protein
LSSVGIVSMKTLRLSTSFATPDHSIIAALAWSPRGLVIGGPSGRVAIWSVRRKRWSPVRRLGGLRVPGGPRAVLELRYGLDSEPQQLVTVPETVEAVATSASGSLVAAADLDHRAGNKPPAARLALWNARTGRRRWLIDLRNESIGGEGAHALAFSPDGRTIAVGLDDGRVRIVDLSSGRIDRTIGKAGGETTGVVALAFAPNGTLATGTWAGVVQLWNPRTGADLARPTEVAAAPVASIAFARDGRTLATTGGSDGLAKIWSATTLQNFAATSPGDPGHWGRAAYTPNGRDLIVVYDDGTGFLWPSRLDAWERHACAVAGRNFTRAEWARLVPGRGYHRVCANHAAPRSGALSTAHGRH